MLVLCHQHRDFYVCIGIGLVPTMTLFPASYSAGPCRWSATTPVSVSWQQDGTNRAPCSAAAFDVIAAGVDVFGTRVDVIAWASSTLPVHQDDGWLVFWRQADEAKMMA